MHFKALSVGVTYQNEQISSDFLHQISKELATVCSALNEKLHIFIK